MALAGVFLTFGYAGAAGLPSGSANSIVPILSQIWASENLTVSGTSSAQAPLEPQILGTPIVRVNSAVDAIISFGTAPNASSPRRAFVPAGETVDFALNQGDKVFWIAA